MLKKAKPRKKLTEAQRQVLRQQVGHERSMPKAAAREAYLKSLLSVPGREQRE